MPTPEFVLELRKKIGHDLLWLNGVTGCVLDDRGRLLLGRRSDTGEWAMVYGINEPHRPCWPMKHSSGGRCRF